MDVSWYQYLIVCPLVFLAGFVDSIAGGGGLISLPAYIISGLPVHQAIATNKLSSSMGTAIATGRFYKSGMINLRIAMPLILSAFGGSHLGAHLTLLIREDMFQIIMLFLVPLTAWYVLRMNPFQKEVEPLPAGKALARGLVIAFLAGIYDGFYGPGTGTFLLILFTGVLHMHLIEANGIAKAINLTTNLSALAVFLYKGAIIIPLGLAAGIFSISGNYFGAKVFMSGGRKVVRPLLLFVLLIFFIKLLYEIIH